MALYRNISVSFWTDRKIDDDFTPEEKYFFLYLLTNPHTNICGCYEIGFKQMARETGYTVEKIKHLLENLEKEHDVIRYDKSTKEVLIINWSKYNWSCSENLKKAVEKSCKKIKSGFFKKILSDYIYNNININNNILQYTESESAVDTAVDTATATATVVTIGYTYPMDTVSDTVTESEKAAETVTNTDINSFKPPTIEEIKAYCKERNNNIDAEAFFDYYTANGWVQGNKDKPLKDWKAAVKLWEKNQYSHKKDNTEADIEEYKSVINKFLY